eukprot:TRINITY_DN20452_c0_g1_i1.p1 TRINITY_DN20452_c0_g1~~TRINITY_DN20452_c0_g1_i1.p1  ORF type:complete len:238 (+),score=23.69 TRINITY_DN20452_c0_g1_i1:48-716(+)
MEQNGPRIADVVASDAESLAMSDAETRDSLESLVERGGHRLAFVWDAEAHQFATWWNALNAVRFVGEEQSQLRLGAPRQFYSQYATAKAHERVTSALKVPFVARQVLKQDFMNLRLLFDFGATYGVTTYYLTSELAGRILSFLGHREEAEDPSNTRSKCLDFGNMCPLFRHRMTRIGLRRSTSSVGSDSDQDIELSDGETISSSGSVSGACESLQQYLSSCN